MIRRFFLGLTIASVAAACSGGSTPESTASKKPVIGVSLFTSTHAFYKELEAGGLVENSTAFARALVVERFWIRIVIARRNQAAEKR